MGKRSLLILAGALVLAVVVVLRFAGKDAKAVESAGTSPRPVAVALATRGPIVNSLSLSGAFRPYQQVDVHAKVAGFIQKIFVDVGDHVRAGQVLEVPELSAQVAGARADLRRDQDAIRQRLRIRAAVRTAQIASLRHFPNDKHGTDIEVPRLEGFDSRARRR
jgi:multidrug efflux pump subunit AcrA (membrane-fusion protein)